MSNPSSPSVTILYRGPLASCNYDCTYCPFAKRTTSGVERKRDQWALERFVHWVATQSQYRLSVFFTPWGEALIHQYYQRAMVTLSHVPWVQKVVIQTNLSCRLAWLADANPRTIAFWATYHPTQTTRRRFVRQCHVLQCYGVRFSVGMVGLQNVLDEVEALRAALPPEVYLWVNAYKTHGGKPVPGYYSAADLQRLQRVDPWFMHNTRVYPSRGRACLTGQSVISVDGDGTIQRCHFLPQPLGNLYDPEFAQVLIPRLCARATCTCHIGYVHMPDLGFDAIFQDGLLERIPVATGHAVRQDVVSHKNQQGGQGSAGFVVSCCTETSKEPI